jgi:hypothetical protein
MKKLIVCLTVSVFALASSVQAGDKATCSDKSSACCSGSKSACSKAATSKKVVMSPKAAGAVGLDKPLKLVS